MKKPAYGSLLLFFLLSLTAPVSAQSLYKVSLDEKIKKSRLIIEGKVTAQYSFWNSEHTMIYTANTVEVYKVFKGIAEKSAIEILTQGGSVDGFSIQASELLQLKKGATGLFFCFPNQLKIQSPVTKNVLYDVYSSAQGFYKYELAGQKAHAPFVAYNEIETSLYKEITRKTGHNFQNKKASFSVQNFARQQQARMAAPAISSFSPAAVTAGTLLDPANNVLTITGTGFGTPSGTAAVLFDDADDGTGGVDYEIDYSDPHIISWTDTEIRIRVPTYAGTGTFKVRDAAGIEVASPAPLQVVYSILTLYFYSGGIFYIKESNLMNDNGSGGYTIHYSNNTAGSGIDMDAHPAKATFQRALNTWKEIVGLNVSEGGITSIQAIAADGTNLVVFDNANTGRPPLPAGVLGICYSYNSMCGGDLTVNQAQKTEFDIVIRNSAFSTGSASFSVGPCPPNSSSYTETDLETVLLHELGHALNLGHINDSYQGSSVGQINPGKLMNYAVVNSVKRVSPDYAAKAGAEYAVAEQGNVYGACLAPNEMTPLVTTYEAKDNCPVTFPATATPAGEMVHFDLAHTTSDRFIDPAYTQVRCDGVGTAVTNNAYYALKTNNAGGTLAVNISNYTTAPVALASCTQVYGSIPVTGVRLALYQVASCPSAQSFPPPVACRTITGNGSLTAFTGLQANSTYLLYADGIENTKATFDLTVGGSVLPIKLTNFTGTAFEQYNELTWTADYAVNVQKLMIEKSTDRMQFIQIGEVTDLNDFRNGHFKDRQPYAETTFYRLRIVNSDGSIEYSEIIQIRRKKAASFLVFPNPATQFIHVQFPTTAENEQHLQLINSTGQIVLTKPVAPGSTGARLDVKHLSSGIYQLNWYNQKGFVESRKIKIDSK